MKSVLAMVLVLGIGVARAGTGAGGGGTGGGSGAENEIARDTTDGPVHARVTVSPARPLVGDRLTLALEVRAEPGVDVRMPAFGDALGRFEIADFVPREERTKDGGFVASQRYTLETPMSGRQSIPPLLVEFTDRRPGQGDASSGPRELLTDEISIEVGSATPGGAVAEALSPPRGRLSEEWPPAPASRAGAVAVGLLLVSSAAVAIALGRRAARARARKTAFDKALSLLEALERRGLPDRAAADGWYVELSGIVRRYVEDRYGLRAPELTTEEFMRSIESSEELAPAHRALLDDFLGRCDRVKFAAYAPEERESREAISAARRFLEETRLGAPLLAQAE